MVKELTRAQKIAFVIPERQRNWDDEMVEWWGRWDAGWRPDTYMVVPMRITVIAPTDPRKAEWRHPVP